MCTGTVYWLKPAGLHLAKPPDATTLSVFVHFPTREEAVDLVTQQAVRIDKKVDARGRYSGREGG